MKKLILLAALALLTGCDSGFHRMSDAQYGVRFRKLPAFLLGGVSSETFAPGETVFTWPWDDLYAFTTTVREVQWANEKELLHTRARDGNEVALRVSVRYHVDPTQGHLKRLVEEVAKDDTQIESLVGAVARSDVRHYLNELRTSEFIEAKARDAAVLKVTEQMNKKLEKYGIRVDLVSLQEYRFERLDPNGKTDDSYQDRLDEVQRLVQEREREESRIATVVAAKEGEYNRVLATVNRTFEEARGEQEQAKIRGDAYKQAKLNEAKAVTSKGNAEVEGTVAQINALNGPGGAAILRLEIAKQLQKSKPRFIVLSEGKGGGGLTLNKVDTNQLLQQMGLFEALKEGGTLPRTTAEAPDKSKNTNGSQNASEEPSRSVNE